MEREYLPGEVRDRIKDLMKERKVNQSELARLAGCNKSTISRFLSGQTDTISDDAIIAIAKGFNVTADFLLGISDKPDRTTFDLAELGLTIESGKALYTSETNAIVINALLGCKSFPALAQLLRQYMEGTAAEGYAAQNQLYADLASLIAGENSEAANAIKALKAPPYQADITHIRNVFDRILVELRQNNMQQYRRDGDALQALIKGAEYGAAKASVQSSNGTYRYKNNASYWTNFFGKNTGDSRLGSYENPDSTFQKYMAGWTDFVNSLDSGDSIRMNLILQSANQYMMAEGNLFSANS